MVCRQPMVFQSKAGALQLVGKTSEVAMVIVLFIVFLSESMFLNPLEVLLLIFEIVENVKGGIYGASSLLARRGQRGTTHCQTFSRSC